MNFKVLDIEMLKNDNLGFTISGSKDTYLRVAKVNPVGLASKAGLKHDDYIIMINGITIKGREDIIKSVEQSSETLNIKVIRYNKGEAKDRSSVSQRNSTLDKRSSTDFQSLHRNLLSTMGSKVGMEITRSYGPTKKSQEIRNSKLIRRSSTNSECVLNDLSSSIPLKKEPNIVQCRMPIKKQTEMKENKIRRRSSDLQSIRSNTTFNLECKLVKEKTASFGQIKLVYEMSEQNVSMDIKSKKFSNESFKMTKDSPTLNASASSVPSRKGLTDLIENGNKREFSSRNLSLRQKKSDDISFMQYKSLSNINQLEKTVSCSPLVKDISSFRKLSNANTSSMISLFDDDLPHSEKSEYTIQWKSIFLKISETTTNDIEISLINYFHNINNKLQLFPQGCLYRFMTYDDVLATVFNIILSPDFKDNVQDEILKTPTDITNFKYDMNTSYIIKLIKCNIKRFSQLVEEYNLRKNNLELTLEQWTETLNKFLKNPDYSVRMTSAINSICKKLAIMCETVMIVVTLISRWKFSIEFPSHYRCQKDSGLLINCEDTLSDFRESQKKLEQQMVNLIRLFKYENSEEILKIVDQIFSENIELGVCLPIFKDKLLNDNKMLEYLEMTPKTGSGPEQFV